MRSRFHAAMMLTLTLASIAFPGRQAAAREEPEPVTTVEPRKANPIPAKAGTLAAKLLLPLYVVDAVNAAGPTTFYAIRNESTSPVDVDVSYYEPDVAPSSPPQLQRTLSLGPKEIETVDVRSDLQDLAVEFDDFARGYIVFETSGGGAVIHGDYFQVDDEGDFASGSRLVNIDPESGGNDLCTRFSMRFLDSDVVFDSGTLFTIWFEPADPFEGIAFSYSVYSEAGGGSLLDFSFPSSRFAFQVSATALRSIVGEEFGAIEFEFPIDTAGHVSAVMSAFGRFSVGFEATCLDPS